MALGPPSIALATYAALPTLADDDRLLVDALAQRGARAVPAVWDDATVDWRAFDAVVIRSCWDYHLRLAEFTAWLDRLQALGVVVCNPPDVLRWNADKTYLRALAASGVRVVPTAWVPRGDQRTLRHVLQSAGWDDAVVKPTISASAWQTWRTSRAAADDHEPRYRALVAHGDALVQPFVDAVVRDGEWSIVFLGGAFSHAVRKRPRDGDFRVQSEHGGSADAEAPPPHVLDAAARALGASPAGGRSLYARVDGCMVDGAFQLMELELLEPSLFLAADPAAAGRLADALLARFE